MEKADILGKLDEVGLLGLRTASCPQGVEFEESEGIFSYGDHLLSDQALMVAAQYSQIPVKFFQRCPDEMKVELLNHFFDGGASPGIVMNDREIISFSGDSDPIDCERAIDTIWRAIPSDPDISRFYATNDRVDLYFVTEESVAVRPGDLVSKGVMTRFSPFGISRPEVSTYMTVLACTNGILRNSTSTKGKNQQRIVLTNCSEMTVLEDDAQTIGSLKFTDEYVLAIQKTDLESQNPSSGSQTTTKGSTYNSEEEEKINKKDQSSNMG